MVKIIDRVYFCIKLNVRGKNTKEKLLSFLNPCPKQQMKCCSLSKTKSTNFFVTEKKFLVGYVTRVKDSTAKSDKNTEHHKRKCGNQQLWLFLCVNSSGMFLCFSRRRHLHWAVKWLCRTLQTGSFIIRRPASLLLYFV